MENHLREKKTVLPVQHFVLASRLVSTSLFGESFIKTLSLADCRMWLSLSIFPVKLSLFLNGLCDFVYAVNKNS